MIAHALALVAAISTPGVDIVHRAPELFVEGEPYGVSVEIRVEAGATAAVPAWLLGPAAFTYNGRPVAKRAEGVTISLEPGAELTLRYDLAPALTVLENFDSKNFRLGFGAERGVAPLEVAFFEAAQKGIDFMTLPVEQLGDYHVVIRTNRGVVRAEMWPAVAPNHVRNFLDLCYSGYYDASTFHRVIPNFMIQGGKSKSGTRPPRTVKAEFSDKKHVPGVLSMARGDDINSGSGEFFVVHGPSPHLDGEFTAFGAVLEGLEVVDTIANSGNPDYPPDDTRSHVPLSEQVMEKVIVVKAPKRRL